jgi:hypothetical protein
MSSIRDGTAPNRRSDDLRYIAAALAHTITFGARLRRPTTQAETIKTDLAVFLKATIGAH